MRIGIAAALIAGASLAGVGCTSTRHYDVNVSAADDFTFSGRVRVTEVRNDNPFDIVGDHNPRVAKVTLYGDDGSVVEISPSVNNPLSMVVAVVRDDSRRASQSLPVAAK